MRVLVMLLKIDDCMRFGDSLTSKMAEEADPIATQHSRSSKVKKLQLKKEMKSVCIYN